MKEIKISKFCLHFFWLLTSLLLGEAIFAAQSRSYRLPETDLKQTVIWGSVCEGPNELALSFGGQDQTAEDGGRPQLYHFALQVLENRRSQAND